MAGIAKRATIEIPIETNGLDRLDKLNSDLNRITDRNDSFRRSFADTSEQLSKFSDRAQEFGKKYQDMMEQSTTSNRDFAKASEEMSKRFNQTQKDMQDAINETKRTQRENTDSTVSDNERISRSHRNIGDEMDRNTDKMSSMKHAGHGLMMTGMNMTMAFGGFTAAAKQGIQEATNLQDQYNKVRILARNGGEQPQEARRNTGALQRQGQQLSTTYGIDQTQLSQGNEDLIRRGYTTSAARGAQPEYSKASLASGDDYNDVVKTGAGALEAFNQRTNNVQQMHNNTKQMLNQLTYGADLTASNYKDLGWAMQYVGSTAHQSHQSSNQTIAALGELSQQNITGTRAGTSLRRIIEGLDNPKANTLSSIGMNPKDLQDSHGNLKNISEDMQLIGQHMQGMSSVQRQNVFKSLFGMQGEQAAQILSSNSKQVDNLNQNIKNAPNMNNGEGYNTSVASQNMQSFKGQSNIAKQNFKAMETSIASSMLPDLAKMVGWANNIFRKINSMSKSQKRLVGWGSLVIAGIGPVILGIGSLTASISSISHAMHKLRGVFSRKMPRTATNSMASQAAENSASSEAIQSSSNGRSSYSNLGSDLSRTDREGSSLTRDASEAGGASTVGKDASKLSRLGRDTGDVSEIGSDASRVSRFSGISRAMPYADIAMSLLPLLGMNHKNNRSRIGESGGTLAGAAGGSALGGGLGTIIPGVGNVAGGTIGGGIGALAGSPFGKQVMQTQIAKSIATSIGHAFNGTPSRQKNVNGTDNSLLHSMNDEFSQAQVRSNARLNNDNSQSAREMVKQNQAVYSTMEKQLDDYNRKRQSKSKSSTDYLKSIHAISNRDINKQDDSGQNRRVKNAQRALRRLRSSETGSYSQRKRAMVQAQKALSNAMGDGSNTQKSILNELSHSTKNISNRQASQLIGSSYKSMRSSIKNANSTYEKTKTAANKRRDTTVSAANNAKDISNSKRRKIIENADKEKNQTIQNALDQKSGTVSQAQDQHNQVVGQAKSQSKNHLKYVNQETGSIQTSWTHLVSWLQTNVLGWFKKAGKWIERFWHDLEYHPSKSLHDISTLFNGSFGDVNIGGDSRGSGSSKIQPSSATRKWTPDIKSNLRKLHQPTSSNNVNRVLKQIQTESKGNPSIVGGNDGDPIEGNATGLMQTKPGTFQEYGRKGGNIKNGNDSIYAGLNYDLHNNGGSLNNLGNGHGYGNGGWSSSPAIFGEVSGQPEVAINPAKPSADSLIQQAIQARSKYNKSQANKQATQSMQGDIGEMMNKQGNSAQKPIQVNQTINISGNASKETARNIGQSTKQAIKQVIDEYFGEKNDSIFNS